MPGVGTEGHLRWHGTTATRYRDPPPGRDSLPSEGLSTIVCKMPHPVDSCPSAGFCKWQAVESEAPPRSRGERSDFCSRDPSGSRHRSLPRLFGCYVESLSVGAQAPETPDPAARSLPSRSPRSQSTPSQSYQPRRCVACGTARGA